MNRAQLIMGWIALAVGRFFWNLTLGTDVTHVADPNTGEQITQYAQSNLHASLLLLAGAVCTWYFLNWINVVNQWERRPLMRFGRYIRTLGPGISFVEPLFNHTLDDVSIQDDTIEVPADNVQTMDNVGLRLVGVLTYSIEEARVQDSVVKVEDVDRSLLDRALSTLTDVSGRTALDAFLEHRAAFCSDITSELAKRVGPWGVKISAFELKDFKINDEKIQQAIAMKARATKEAEAELQRAKMQEQIAEALNKAASTYNTEGRWLKGLETLTELCRSGQNNTVLIPTDLTAALTHLVPSAQVPEPAAA